MKKSFLMLGLSLVVLFSFSLVVQAQTGKEIIEPVTSTWYGTFKNLPLEKGCIFQTWEALGIVMSETGTGL
jgi:hypothetical protein